MIGGFFHRWEQRLAEVSRDERVVRPFDWGLDWLGHHTGLFEADPSMAPSPNGWTFWMLIASPECSGIGWS